MKEVICIKSHSQGVVKEGNIYQVLTSMNVECQCGPKVLYNVGIVAPPRARSVCKNCGTKRVFDSPMYWIDSKLFAELGDISELTEILTKQASM